MSEVLLSQLAHVELMSPKPDETVKWMVDVLGLEETTREGQSVYLRGWAEWLHSSLVVSEGPRPEIGHIAWRTYGPQDVDTIAARFAQSDDAIGWVESSVGHGKAFRYHAPHGRHTHEVFWESELYKAPAAKVERDFKNRPQKFPGRGAQARYLDHITIATPDIAADIAFYQTLGQRHTLQICPEPGFSVFATMTCNAIRSCHDLGLVPDFSGATVRVNHLAYRVDQRIDVDRAAEVFMANDTPIEFGPGVHGADEITYVYVREPGGFRIEINAGGWENYLPDWKATTWDTSQGATTFWKNLEMPHSMMDCFPPVEDVAAKAASEGFETTQMFVKQ